MTRLPVRLGCNHAVRHRVNECIDPAANVLHVKYSRSTSDNISLVGSLVSLYKE
jgi:hypothetical protein